MQGNVNFPDLALFDARKYFLFWYFFVICKKV